ncbi:MAG: hypothetical protein CO108_24805 [Deltaproteobacteria bacterium CG_4_9_14_3_um_filter_63_12]|nr:MAG: hypothetical protein CO108_24805 [Deltaproteobacteria bacterium CG_4_9_14_3_um_filter_63_12]
MAPQPLWRRFARRSGRSSTEAFGRRSLGQRRPRRSGKCLRPCPGMRRNEYNPWVNPGCGPLTGAAACAMLRRTRAS